MVKRGCSILYITGARFSQTYEIKLRIDVSGCLRLSVLDLYVEDMLEEAFRTALPLASRALVNQDLASSLSSAEAQNSISSLEQYLPRQSSMDHLEVNFRDWYQQFRRRSSNLSDLSSRRSSDIASRRSSACSAKGYSSEFSSEFEEYYDNFQMQEQRYRYHTIKEEVGSTAVIEFAASLAASLLQQGTHEAAVQNTSPQTFDNFPPEDDHIEKPTPVRVLTMSSANEITMYKLVANYVCNLIESVWPFGQGGNICEEVKCKIIEGYKNKKLGSGDPDVVAVQESMDENVNDENVNEKDTNDDVNVANVNDSLMSDSGSSSGGTVYSIVEVDDEILLAVADRIVTVAFQEALLECKYSLSMTKNHACHSFSESSQSDHSMDAKDQADSSVLEATGQSHSAVSTDNKNLDPAHRIAEKMVSGIFSKRELPSTSVRSKVTSESAGSSVKDNLRDDDCDTTNSFSSPHSGLNSDRMSQKQLDMYDRIAERLLHGGLASGLDVSQCNVGGQPQTLSSNTNTLNCDHNQYSSQCLSDALIVKDKGSSSSSSVGKLLPSTRAKEEESRHRGSHEAAKSRNISATDKSSGAGLAKPVVKVKIDTDDNCNSSASSAGHSVLSGQLSKASSSKTSGGLTGHTSSGASCKKPKTSPDTSSSDSSGLLGAMGEAVPPTSGHDSDTPRPPSQSKIKPKPSHPFITGNRKNYDQFANSLSRDLLTNAFLQVQEHQEFVSYPRRSSEPMQISNGAALQRLEQSAHGANCQRSQKSKTDEDIATFDWEWSQQLTSRTSSGFRDPVLSR